MATRVLRRLLGSSKDGMFEGAYSKNWRWRFGRFYECTRVVVCFVCQLKNARVLSEGASLPEPSGCFAPASQ
jgi:hypothetical protein